MADAVENSNIYNLFKSFINTVLSFSNIDVNIICG